MQEIAYTAKGILQGLLQQNFKNFLRVGSLKRIAKSILPYSLHKDKDRKGKDAEEKETAEALKELQVGAFPSLL